MAVETVLMYNCSGPEWAKLRQMFSDASGAHPDGRAGSVRPYPGGLLNRTEEKAGVEEEFHEPMLVFCHMSHDTLDHLLTTMGRAGLPRMP